MAYELEMGDAWNPWRYEGLKYSEVDVKVVVYRGIALEEVQKQFPVIKGKSDYRYLEYARAVRFFQENIKGVEDYKQNASDERELKMWDDLAELLKKSHERIIENLGVQVADHSLRKVRIGSIFVARRAGMPDATSVIVMTSVAMRM